jgi:tRNA A-37 threonylcarbamoyl transferase component Bud32
MAGDTARLLREAPRRAVDVILHAAIHGAAETVFIEPVAEGGDVYLISMERGTTVLATATLDARIATAGIARLGYLADVDLATGAPATGRAKVRVGAQVAEIVVTIRPGTDLRADLMVIRRAAPPTRQGFIEPMPGDTIDRYRILQRLGQGGMGTVYRVEHVALGRTYALKALRASMVRNQPGAAAQFLHEARAAARIRHPSIVDVFDFGELPDGRPYFVMELLSGRSLADVIDAGPIEPAAVIHVIRQLAEALAATHDRGVVHADVTPNNILIDGDNPEMHVKLVDFGLAELVGDAMYVDDEAESLYGTPAYVSPEQIRGLRATERSDQYSLGIVMFEMISGKPPFDHPNVRELCLLHLGAPVPALASPFGPLPPRLIDIVNTMLQKTPGTRFPNLRALINALSDVEEVAGRRGWRKWLSR